MLEPLAGLALRYRAIGKVGAAAAAAGVRNTSSDLRTEDAAVLYGSQLVLNGNWSEFYVKTIVLRP